MKKNQTFGIIFLTVICMQTKNLYLLNWALLLGGRCPAPPRFGTCVEACGRDGGCKAGQLCCSNGCGHTCQDAIFGEFCVVDKVK